MRCYSQPGVKRWIPLVSNLALAGGVFALYAAGIDRGFVFDDHEVILAQPAPRDVGDVLQIFRERHIVDLPYYRPVTRATLLLQKSLHGADPVPFHLFNAALMAALALCAHALLRVPSLGIARAPALLAAALFAVHPVASSCVYPIASGRETALPALWVIAAIWGWLRGRPLLAHSALVLALLSKEQAAVVPAVFLAADLLGLCGPARRAPREWAVRYAPSVVVLGLYAVLRAKLFGGSEFAAGSLLGPLWSYGYALQVLIAPTRALVYEPEIEVWSSIPRMAAVAGALLATGLAAWRMRVERAPLLFWLGWFAILQLPTANLLEQEARFDERYVFLASLGLWAVLATLASQGRGVARVRVATLFCGALVVGIAAGLTSARAAYFADDAAFVGQWHRSSPDSLDANVHLGRVRLIQGRLEEAEGLYARAIELNPGSAPARLGLGRVLHETGRVDEARIEYARAVVLDPRDAYARFYLAVMLERAGAPEDAIRHYREALRRKPNIAEAHFNLANLLERGGAAREAIEEYRLALHYEPGFASARLNLANTLSKGGRFEEAIPHYLEVKKYAPEGIAPRNNLALALAHVGRVEEAEHELREALALAPDDAMTRRNLRWLADRREQAGLEDPQTRETGTR